MSGATITDVARQASVSIKTVSRVVNADLTVKARNRKRVEDAIRALGYVPNLAARALRNTKSHLIAFFFEMPDSENLGPIQSGVLVACRASSYHLIVERLAGDDPHRLENVSALVRRNQIDGAILMPPLSDDPELIALLDALAVAYVLIAPSRPHASAPAVWADDFGAARAVTRRLLDDGHRAIAFVRSGDSHPVSAPRYAGFLAALSDSGLPARAEWIIQGQFSVTSGIEAGNTLFGLSERPTAVFASNDHLAIGVMSSASTHGLRVPEDLSVFGFDGSEISTIVTPALSTVSQPVTTIALRACELLFEKMRGGTPADLTLPEFTVLSRQSSAPLLREEQL